MGGVRGKDELGLRFVQRNIVNMIKTLGAREDLRQLQDIIQEKRGEIVLMNEFGTKRESVNQQRLCCSKESLGSFPAATGGGRCDH